MKSTLSVNEADIGKRIGNIGDLPESVRSQLEIAQVDDVEQKILRTLKQRFGGIATVDEVIVGLYRDFAYEARSRQDVIDKLTRMVNAGLLLVVAGKQGVYEMTEAGHAIELPLADLPLSARL